MWKYAIVEMHYIIAYTAIVKHISLCSSEGNIFSPYLDKKKMQKIFIYCTCTDFCLLGTEHD